MNMENQHKNQCENRTNRTDRTDGDRIDGTYRTDGDRTDRTHRTHGTDHDGGLLFRHGGYRELKSFQMSTIVYDLTVEFCKKYIDRTYGANRTHDQMVQAARSGRQNIAEGSKASGTSKKTELKLTNVARASLEELLLDYEDFLRQKRLPMWTKDDARAKIVRNLCYTNLSHLSHNQSPLSYQSYEPYLSSPENAANMLVCIIHQANYLLDQQIKKLSREFLQKGGFNERIYRKRTEARQRNF